MRYNKCLQSLSLPQSTRYSLHSRFNQHNTNAVAKKSIRYVSNHFSFSIYKTVHFLFFLQINKTKTPGNISPNTFPFFKFWTPGKVREDEVIVGLIGRVHPPNGLHHTGVIWQGCEVMFFSLKKERVKLQNIKDGSSLWSYPYLSMYRERYFIAKLDNICHCSLGLHIALCVYQ